MRWTTKENFGGESRFKAQVEKELNIKVIETKGIYTGTGTPNITGVRTMPDLESKEFFNELKKFIGNQDK